MTRRDAPRRPERFDAARDRLENAKEAATGRYRRIEASRSRRPLVDTALALYERDRDILGTMLSGAVAFRLFVWLVPYALLLVTLLGIFLDTSPGGSGASLFEHLGIGGELAEALSSTARESWTSRVWALLIGAFGSMWTAKGVVRALRLTHSAAWGTDARPARGGLVRASAGVVVVVSTIVLAIGVAAWVRWETTIGGLITTLAIVAVMGVAWLAVSRHMPHPRALPARARVPGAVLVALGMQALHLVTAYYLLGYADRAQSLYGTIGTAVVLLLWLFIIARLLVSSAVLNAVLWEREQAGAPAPHVLGVPLYPTARRPRHSRPRTGAPGRE